MYVEMSWSVPRVRQNALEAMSAPRRLPVLEVAPCWSLCHTTAIRIARYRYKGLSTMHREARRCTTRRACLAALCCDINYCTVQINFRAKNALELRVLEATRHTTAAVEGEMAARLESDRWRLRCEQVCTRNVTFSVLSF